MDHERAEVDELVLDGQRGLWVVTSSGPTRYIVDVDARPPLCMRVPGAKTPSHGATDSRWAPVLRVRSVAGGATVTPGVVRVGERPLWDLDHGDEVVWWLQRMVTAIKPISRADVPAPVAEPSTGLVLRGVLDDLLPLDDALEGDIAGAIELNEG